MARIPVHIVTGEAGSGKSALIARLCAGRPDWIGLVNAAPPGGGPGLRLFSAGCPCCTGKVVLQVSLVRALRETRAVRAFVEVAGPEHALMLERSLGEMPFSLSVACEGSIMMTAGAGFLIERASLLSLRVMVHLSGSREGRVDHRFTTASVEYGVNGQ